MEQLLYIIALELLNHYKEAHSEKDFIERIKPLLALLSESALRQLSSCFSTIYEHL